MQLGGVCPRCGGRTTRRVNPAAMQKGTVYVQCEQCKVWHNLVDHLSWMGETYDLRTEREKEAGDQREKSPEAGDGA